MVVIADVVALILAFLAGLLYASLGFHSLPGYLASGLVGLISSLVMAFFCTRKRTS